MNKLEQLIKEFCPDGILYKQIEEVVLSISTGLNPRKNFVLNATGADCYYVTVKEMASGTIKFTDKTDKITQDAVAIIQMRSKLAVGDLLLSGIGTIGRVALVDMPVDNWNCSESVTVIKPNSDIINSKFLLYILRSEKSQKYFNENATGSTLKGIRKKDLLTLKLPVPPLPVQEEIVRVLDELTEKTDKLISVLNAELDERKKQYEYFQNQLFAKSEDMQYVDVPLGDIIVSLKTGLNPRKNFKLNTPDSCCPYITGKDIFNNKVNVTARTDEITMDAVALINKRACIETDDLLFASTGTGTVGRMAIVEDYKGDWSISESIYAIKGNKDIVLPQFLMYLLYTENVMSQYKPKITKASVPHLKVADLLKVKISIPSIQEQKRIIKAAETFTATQDLLISNLMHEIENRKKQYEYYRDKLLTF